MFRDQTQPWGCLPQGSARAAPRRRHEHNETRERWGSPALILASREGNSGPQWPDVGNGGLEVKPLSLGLEALEVSREAGGAVNGPQGAPGSARHTAPLAPINLTLEPLHWPKGKLAGGTKTHQCNCKTRRQQGDRSRCSEVRGQETGRGAREVHRAGTCWGQGHGAGAVTGSGTSACDRASVPCPPSRHCPAPRGCVLVQRRAGFAGHLTLGSRPSGRAQGLGYPQ